MSYPGGKAGAGVYQTLINLMPPHEIYIEPFLGMGAVLRRKKAAPIATIGVDADKDVLKLWRGTGKQPGVQVICADGIRFLEERKWTGRELVYCDPPYLIHTRLQQRRIYRYELEEADHRRLLDVLLQLPCLVMISGYDSMLYRQKLRGWIHETFTAVTRGGTVATEFVWMNYSKPDVLHDYRYVGRNFRERQDMKRKAARWRARLVGMPMRDRLSVLSALVDLASPLVPMSAETGRITYGRRQRTAETPVRDPAGVIGEAALSGSRAVKSGRNGIPADGVLRSGKPAVAISRLTRAK